MTAASARIREILALARQEGRVTVEDLAARFGVSAQTVRKDLATICNQGLLRRTYGGAVAVAGIENLDHGARELLAPAEKRAIAEAAVGYIPNDASLMINIGTTTEAVARRLGQHQNLMVITNNMNVAEILRPVGQIDVVIAGGLVRASDGGIVGSTAVDFISQFKMDFAIIGTSAIDPDGSLLDFDLREVKVAQAILQNARKAILVADSSKFHRTAPVRAAHLSQLAMLVTDRVPDPEFRAQLADWNVALVETEPADTIEA